MSRRAVAVAFLAALLLSGCTKARIDASSDQALRESLPAVRADLEAGEQKRFDSLVAAAVAQSVLADLRGERRELRELLGTYDRMTGRQALAHHDTMTRKDRDAAADTPGAVTDPRRQ